MCTGFSGSVMVLVSEKMSNTRSGRRAGVEHEREQEADRLDGPAQHDRHREEREQLRLVDLPHRDQPDARHQAQTERDLRHEVEPEPDGRDRAGLAHLGLAQSLGLPAEAAEGVLAAPERLEHADAVHALLHTGGEVTGLILAATGEGAVALLEQVAADPQRDRGHQKITPRSQCHRNSSTDPMMIVRMLTTSSTRPNASQRRMRPMSCIMRLSS